MLRNYLKIGFRNLIRQKAFSLINIIGLAIGLACSILIFLWIKNETSYDKFHENSEDIYRITCQVENIKAAVNPAPLGLAMLDQFPEVQEALRTSAQETRLLEVGAQKYEEKRIFFVDTNFFQFFSFRLERGDETIALEAPQSIIISKAMANKYFGSNNPMGQTIRIDNKDDMTVTGVLKNLKTPSHLKFDFLIPMTYLARTNRDLQETVWDNFNFYSYVKLFPSALKQVDIKSLGTKVNELYTANESELKVNFSLQPLTDIHLYSNFLGDVPGHGNIQYVYIFFFIAVFILLIACINFMNLSTARSARRAREVGFRKVAGAGRKQLIVQFLTESSLIAFLSLLIAIGIVLLVMPAFNLISGHQMSLDYFDPTLILGTLIITLIIGLLAGSYPALYLSGFKPVKVLSMQRNPGGGHQIFRNILVIVQFVFSIMLIIGTVVVHQQQGYIRDRNLGYDKENLLYIALRGPIRDNQEALRSALQNNNLTERFSIVGELPTNLVNATIDIEWAGKNPDQQVLFSTLDVDSYFKDVFSTSMVAGRSFSEDYQTDEKKYLVNERALQIMEMEPEEAIGKAFALWGGTGTILGVVKDFHFKPIQQPIDPMVIRYNKYGGYAVVRTQPGKTDATIDQLKNIHQKLDPEYPFEYGFLDQDLENLYQSEKMLGRLINVFALLAIFISCLGLFGLSAFLAERRKKEIGIRKVVGASISSVVYLLAKDFTKPIWVAMLIALPLAFYVVNRWLENFAFHIELQWWVLVLSCLAAWLIALITVSFETLRAAFAHPSDSLQNE